MANLAIKGHSTRGSEVIALLEMLGGKNIYNLTGTKEIWHILSDGPIEHSTYIFEEKGFTLEEFLEKFPYKVGDKVTLDKFPCTIKGMSWDCDDVIYYVQGVDFSKGVYSKDKDLQPYKEETMERIYNVEEYLKVWEETEKGLEVVVNDKFELKEDNGKFYIIKKQLQYPKTYEECCVILQLEHTFELKDLTIDEEKLTDSFIRLKRCRDAYWKIAGDWKPDVMYCDLYCIGYDGYVITWKMQGGCRLLAFPTKEMRDAFYENFKELIEAVKELL